MLLAAVRITDAPCEYPTSANFASGHAAACVFNRLMTSLAPVCTPLMLMLAGYYVRLAIVKASKMEDTCLDGITSSLWNGNCQVRNERIADHHAKLSSLGFVVALTGSSGNKQFQRSTTRWNMSRVRRDCLS